MNSSLTTMFCLTWVKPTQYFTKRVNMTSGIVLDIGTFSSNHHFEMYTMYHKVHIVHTKSKQWWSQEELHMPSFCLGSYKCSGSTILHDIYKERWYPLVGVDAIPLPGFYRLPSCQIFNAECQEGWNDYQFSSLWSDPAVLTRHYKQKAKILLSCHAVAYIKTGPYCVFRFCNKNFLKEVLFE